MQLDLMKQNAVDLKNKTGHLEGKHTHVNTKPLTVGPVMHLVTKHPTAVESIQRLHNLSKKAYKLVHKTRF